MKADKDFYERYAQTYRSDLAIRRAQLRVILEALDFHDKVGLDEGCGDGFFATALAKNGAKEVVGCDLSETAVRIARKRAKRNGIGEKTIFNVCEASNLPFSEGSFDFILCLEVLEHVRDPQRTNSELKRVLKSGAILVLAVPNILNPAELLHTLKHLVLFYLKREPITHINHFTYWSIQKMLGPFAIRGIQGLHFLTAFLSLRAEGKSNPIISGVHMVDMAIGRMVPFLAFDLFIIAEKRKGYLRKDGR